MGHMTSSPAPVCKCWLGYLLADLGQPLSYPPRITPLCALSTSLCGLPCAGGTGAPDPSWALARGTPRQQQHQPKHTVTWIFLPPTPTPPLP